MSNRISKYTKKLKDVSLYESRKFMFGLRGRYQDFVTINSRQGVYTVSTMDHAIGQALYIDGAYEYESSVRSVRFLQAEGFLPSSGITLLDVGANIGIISIGLLRADLGIQRALAIEPEPNNFDLLTRNVKQNSLGDRIECIQAAVSEEVSTLTMELSGWNFGDHRIRATDPQVQGKNNESRRNTVTVPSLPLPDILSSQQIAQDVDANLLLWIDVQGYEGHVFRGAAPLLAKGIPTVTEVWPYGILRSGVSLEEYCSIVQSHWSDFWVDRRGRYVRYPISVFDRYLDEIGTGEYYENIVLTNKTDIAQDQSSIQP